MKTWLLVLLVLLSAALTGCVQVKEPDKEGYGYDSSFGRSPFEVTDEKKKEN